MMVVSDTSPDLRDVVLHLRGDRAQLIAVIMLAPQRHRQNGNIVDGARLDQRLRNSRRHTIEVRVELAIDLDQRVFLGRADKKTYNHQALPRRRSRVHIFNARNLMHQVLDRQRYPLFHLGRGCARHSGGNVQHRNKDLRLFLARNDRDREDSNGQRAGNEKRRKFGVEKCMRQSSGYSKVLASWLNLNAFACNVPV